MKRNELDLTKIEELMESFPAKLVAMMYDQAIDTLNEAIAAIEKGDIATRFARTSRVADIVEVLHASLDLNEGGDIAANLDQLYRYVITQLPMINIHNDAALTQSLIDLLTPLRDSWVELDERIGHDVAQAENAPRPFGPQRYPSFQLELAGAA